MANARHIWDNWRISRNCLTMLLLLLAYFVNISGGTGVGTRYVLNVISDVSCTSDVRLSLTSLGSVDADVSIRVPLREDVDTVNISAGFGYWANVTLPSSVRIHQPGVNENGIEVTSTSAISLYVTERAQCGGGAIHILPSDQLGTHYILDTNRNSSSQTTTAVTVTATAHRTQITAKLVAANSSNNHISFEGAIYRAGETLRVELNRFQCLLFEYSHAEATRLEVTSSADVAVFVAEGVHTGRLATDDGDRTPPLFGSTTLQQLTPVSNWGKTFVSFPFSQGGDTIQITAAENSTRLSLHRKTTTKATNVNLSTYLPLTLHLPMGDYIYISANKPLLVLQRVDGGCLVASRQPDMACPVANVLTVPSTERISRRYILRPLVQDEGQPVEINLMARRDGNLRLNNETLSSYHKDVLNVTLYGISGDFNLYTLRLLASSGTIEHQTDGFLILTPTSAFIHPDTQRQRTPGPTPGANDSESSSAYPDVAAGLATDPEGQTESSQRSAHATPKVDVVVGDKSPTTTNPFQRRPEKEFRKTYDRNRLNDIIKMKNPGPHYRRLPPILEPTGVPFVVKAAGDARQEVNFHEAESRGVRRDVSDDADPGLDVTVIAVIVSLASAVILAFVFVFGFLMAEFLCRRNLFNLSKVSPYVE